MLEVKSKYIPVHVIWSSLLKNKEGNLMNDMRITDMEIINIFNSRTEKNTLSDELIKNLKEIKYDNNCYYLGLDPFLKGFIK